MVEYKLKFYSVKKNKDELIHFKNKEEFYSFVNTLLGHTFIKDLKAFHYDRIKHEYKEIKL